MTPIHISYEQAESHKTCELLGEQVLDLVQLIRRNFPDNATVRLGVFFDVTPDVIRRTPWPNDYMVGDAPVEEAKP